MLDNPIKLSKEVTVGIQPSEEELEQLAKKGFASVVNLSTSGELGQQLKPEEEAAVVKGLGMEYLHFPVSLSRLKNVELSEFFAAVSELPKPVYIHCRIGQRAVPFGLLVHARKRELDFSGVVSRGEKLGISLDIPSVSSFVKKGIASFSSDGDAAAA